MAGGARRAARMVGRVVGRVAAGCALVLGAGLLVAAPASAHAELVRSDPADGATLDRAPQQVRLDLSEAVVERSFTVTMTDGSGHRVLPTAVRIAAGSTKSLLITAPGDPRTPATVLVALPPLRPDVYRLTWHTLSADDLHSTGGVIVFGVQHAVAGAGGPGADPAPRPGQVILRWLGLLGTGTATGALLMSWLLGAGLSGAGLSGAGLPGTRTEAQGARRRALRAGVLAGGLAVASQGALLIVQAGAAGGGLDQARELLTSLAYGPRWALHEATSTALALLCAAGLRRTGDLPGRRSRAAGALMMLGYGLSDELMSHAGATAQAHPLRLLLAAAHVCAGLVWAGALVAAVVAVVPGGAHPDAAALRRRTLAAFGRVGAGCLLAVTATGLVLAGADVVSPDAALMSTYGRVLLAKVGLVVAAATFAGVNTLLLRPRLLPGPVGRLAVARVPGARGVAVRPPALVAVEATLLGAVLLGAAALASSQPAVGAAWAPAVTSEPLQAGEVSHLVETLQVSPNRPGTNFVTVDVFDALRPSPGPVQQVTVTLRQGSGAAVVVPLRLQPSRYTASSENLVTDGRWLASTPAISAPGTWTVTVTAVRAGLRPVTGSYSWQVADPRARLTRTVVSSAPWAGLLDRSAGVLAVVGILAALTDFGFRRRRRRRWAGPPPAAGSGTARAPAPARPPAATAAAATPEEVPAPEWAGSRGG